MITVLKPFFAFASSIQFQSAHNMLVLMLDPCFKNLQLIQNYVGLEVVMEIVVEYDRTILMPLLLTVYNNQNPNYC